MATIQLIGLDRETTQKATHWLGRRGHQVLSAADPRVGIELILSADADVVVLDLVMDGMSGCELVRCLRSSPTGAEVPVLVLSSVADRERRVEALRLGADDCATKPCQWEELVWRIERLADLAARDRSPLEGDLEVQSVWLLVQSLQNAEQSGRLILETDAGRASMWLDRGRIFEARLGGLCGHEALLALFEARRGRFYYRPEDGPEHPPAEEAQLDFQRIALEAAWLEDQLAKWRDLVPRPHQPLETRSPASPGFPDDPRDLPVSEVRDQLERIGSAADLATLEENLAFAPQKVRLAVAWLRSRGLVDLRTEGAGACSPAPTPPAVEQLLDALSSRRDRPELVQILLAASPAAWPCVVGLFHCRSGECHFADSQPATPLRSRLETHRQASRDWVCECGKLLIHAIELTPARHPQALALAPLCSAVVVWLSSADDPNLVLSLLERVDGCQRPVLTVIVPDGAPESHAGGRGLAGGQRRLLTSPLTTFEDLVECLADAATSADGPNRRRRCSSISKPAQKRHRMLNRGPS